MAGRKFNRKIPLTNNDREIMKRAVFNCCRREWKRVLNPSENNLEQRCNNCHCWVSPRFEEWSKRWFGSFKCTSKSCGRTWTSSWTWTVDNQLQTTQCQNCKTSVLPYQLDELRGKDLDEDDSEQDGQDLTKPHRQDLCSRCKQLGRRCTEDDPDDLAGVMDNLNLNRSYNPYEYDSYDYDSY